jgi:hypothetical protein
VAQLFQPISHYLVKVSPPGFLSFSLSFPTVPSWGGLFNNGGSLGWHIGVLKYWRV